MAAKKAYQIRIELRDIDPPIWRRVLVWEDTTLAELHGILQIVMGWEDCHLHDFQIGAGTYGIPSPDDSVHGLKVVDERKARLNTVLDRVGAGFLYRYDFGDDWHHDLVLEAILPPEPAAKYPRCIDGRRSGPPEDTGGPYGYADYLQALADPKHENHEEMLAWRGRFDPEAFSLQRIDQQLRRSFRSAGGGRRARGAVARRASSSTPSLRRRSRRLWPS